MLLILEKARKGERVGGKYIKRWWDFDQRRWNYEYSDKPHPKHHGIVFTGTQEHTISNLAEPGAKVKEAFHQARAKMLQHGDDKHEAIFRDPGGKPWFKLVIKRGAAKPFYILPPDEDRLRENITRFPTWDAMENWFQRTRTARRVDDAHGKPWFDVRLAGQSEVTSPSERMSVRYRKDSPYNPFPHEDSKWGPSPFKWGNHEEWIKESHRKQKARAERPAVSFAPDPHRPLTSAVEGGEFVWNPVQVPYKVGPKGKQKRGRIWIREIDIQGGKNRQRFYEHLIAEHFGLIVRTADRMAKIYHISDGKNQDKLIGIKMDEKGLPKVDPESPVMMAVQRAANGYDPTKGWRFNTYLGDCLWREMFHKTKKIVAEIVEARKRKSTVGRGDPNVSTDIYETLDIRQAAPGAEEAVGQASRLPSPEEQLLEREEQHGQALQSWKSRQDDKINGYVVNPEINSTQRLHALDASEELERVSNTHHAKEWVAKWQSEGGDDFVEPLKVGDAYRKPTAKEKKVWIKFVGDHRLLSAREKAALLVLAPDGDLINIKPIYKTIGQLHKKYPKLFPRKVMLNQMIQLFLDANRKLVGSPEFEAMERKRQEAVEKALSILRGKRPRPEDKETTIKLRCRGEMAERVVELLKKIKSVSGGGSSRQWGIMDPSGRDEQSVGVGIDGDGADKIVDMWVNGKLAKSIGLVGDVFVVPDPILDILKGIPKGGKARDFKYWKREGHPGHYNYTYKEHVGGGHHNIVEATNAPVGHGDHDESAGPPQLHSSEPDPALHPQYFDQHSRKLNRKIPEHAEWNGEYNQEQPDQKWAARWRHDPEDPESHLEHGYYDNDFRGRQEYKFTIENQHFDEQIPKIRQFTKMMVKSPHHKDQVLGLMVSLLDQAFMRPGKKQHEKKTGAVGLVTLKKGNAKISGNSVTFDYVGKKQIKQQQTVTLDKPLMDIMKKLVTAPGKKAGDYLFSVPARFRGDRVVYREIGENLLRRTLKANFNVKPKQFRTYHGTQLFSKTFQQVLGNVKGRVTPKVIDSAIEESAMEVAKALGHYRRDKEGKQTIHTQTALGSYVDPNVVRSLVMNVMNPENNMEKGYKLQGRTTFQGLPISIENKKGSSRSWYDKHNDQSGTTKMHHDYGYIRRTKGTDGDHVDVYLGPNDQAGTAYVVHQQKAPDFKRFDEDKVMLGFNSAKEAKAAYLKQYDKPGFFGSMTAIPMGTFTEKVFATKDKPMMLKSYVWFAHDLVKAEDEDLGQIGLGPDASSSAGEQPQVDPSEPQHTFTSEDEEPLSPPEENPQDQMDFDPEKEDVDKIKPGVVDRDEDDDGSRTHHVVSNPADRSEDETHFSYWLHTHPMHQSEGEWEGAKQMGFGHDLHQPIDEDDPDHADHPDHEPGQAPRSGSDSVLEPNEGAEVPGQELGEESGSPTPETASGIEEPPGSAPEQETAPAPAEGSTAAPEESDEDLSYLDSWNPHEGFEERKASPSTKGVQD